MEKTKFKFSTLLLLTLALAVIYFLLNYFSIGDNRKQELQQPIIPVSVTQSVTQIPVAVATSPVSSMISDIKIGTGAMSQKGMKVSVHYTGKLLNGTTFDSSIGKDPLSFIIGSGRVIKGWDIGILGMKVGGTRTLTVPPELAYGKPGIPGVIPQSSTLIFTVELVAVSKPKVSSDTVKTTGVTNISNQQLEKLLEMDIALIDIRREEEWKETGVIAGSHLITLYNSNQTIHKDFNDKFSAIIKDGTTPFILICRTGSRTRFASDIMVKSMGLSNVYNVQAGITHWIREGNPVVKVN